MNKKLACANYVLADSNIFLPLKNGDIIIADYIPLKKNYIWFVLVDYIVFYTIPCAIIALATFMKPHTFAPFM